MLDLEVQLHDYRTWYWSSTWKYCVHYPEGWTLSLTVLLVHYNVNTPVCHMLSVLYRNSFAHEHSVLQHCQLPLLNFPSLSQNLMKSKLVKPNLPQLMTPGRAGHKSPSAAPPIEPFWLLTWGYWFSVRAAGHAQNVTVDRRGSGGVRGEFHIGCIFSREHTCCFFPPASEVPCSVWF